MLKDSFSYQSFDITQYQLKSKFQVLSNSLGQATVEGEINSG